MVRRLTGGIVVLWALACGGAVEIESPPASGPAPAPAAAPSPRAPVPPTARPATLERPAELRVDNGFGVDVYAIEPVARPVPVTSSSALRDGGTTHGGERALDGDLATAWCEGVAGDGVGESLRLDRRGDERLPDLIGVVPGYAKDPARWRQNRRVRQLHVAFLHPRDGATAGPTGWAREDLVDSHVGVLVELAPTDDARAQYVDLGGLWQQEMSETEIVATELRIAAVDASGSKYEDTCVSEIELFVAGKQVGMGGFNREQERFIEYRYGPDGTPVEVPSPR